METLVKILHVIVCIFLMLTVLLQAGKGGGMGAAFGGGSSMGTVFGGSGAGNFLRRLTVGAAVIFMITSMTLAWMSTPTTDPVKKYMAQQYKAMMDREKAHKEAMGGAKAPATDGKQTPEGEGVGPDEMIETPEGTEGGEDAIDTPDGEGTEGGTSEAPETIDTPAPEPAAAKKPPAETPKPKAKPVPPPAAPVAPPPESSSTTPP